jgi:hypothetical protein
MFNKKLFLRHLKNLSESHYIQHQGRLAPFISKFTNQPKEFQNICAQYAEQILTSTKLADISRAEEIRIQKIATFIQRMDLISAQELLNATEPKLRSLIPEPIQKFVERYS